MKRNDLVRGVHHAQAVGHLGVVHLVEVLVQHFQELLLLVVVLDAGGRRVDGLVVVLQHGQQVLALAVAEQGGHQPLQLLGDVVLPVEVGLVEDLVEDVGREDVLDHHFADVRLGDVRVDLRLAQGPELFTRRDEGHVLLARRLDLVA